VVFRRRMSGRYFLLLGCLWESVRGEIRLLNYFELELMLLSSLQFMVSQ
jgi:hypothetical protein